MEKLVLTEHEFITTQKRIIDASLSMTMGSFDGLHQGHQALLAQTLEVARKRGLKSALLTFDFSAVDLHKRQHHLLTDSETEAKLAQQGFDYYIIVAFGTRLKALDPEAYLKALTTLFDIKAMIVGEDFLFGNDRRGNVATLREYMSTFGYMLYTIPLVTAGGQRISSSRIEQLLIAGELEEANALLGYTYALDGTVIHGEQQGRKLGFPTANMVLPLEKIALPNGVYVVAVAVGQKMYGGATNIGVSPTIKTTSERLVETYIFDFIGDLYGQAITVYFFKRLRDEQKFADITALKQQMEADIEQSKAYLAAQGDVLGG